MATQLRRSTSIRDQQSSFTVYLDSTDCILCKLAPCWVSSIIHRFYSSIIAQVICGAIWIIWFIGAHYYEHYWYSIIPFFPCILWLFFIFLTTNSFVVKAVIFQFDITFYYKCLMALICFSACMLVTEYTFTHLLDQILLVFCIAMWSLSDGWCVSRIMKLLFGIYLISSLAIHHWVLYKANINDDVKLRPLMYFNIDTQTNEAVISLRDLGVAATLNLIIFLIVQLVRLIRKPDEIHVIHKQVTVKWDIDPSDRMSTLHSQTSIADIANFGNYQTQEGSQQLDNNNYNHEIDKPSKHGRNRRWMDSVDVHVDYADSIDYNNNNNSSGRTSGINGSSGQIRSASAGNIGRNNRNSNVKNGIMNFGYGSKKSKKDVDISVEIVGNVKKNGINITNNTNSSGDRRREDGLFVLNSKPIGSRMKSLHSLHSANSANTAGDSGDDSETDTQDDNQDIDNNNDNDNDEDTLNDDDVEIIMEQKNSESVSKKKVMFAESGSTDSVDQNRQIASVGHPAESANTDIEQAVQPVYVQTGQAGQAGATVNVNVVKTGLPAVERSVTNENNDDDHDYGAGNENVVGVVNDEEMSNDNDNDNNESIEKIKIGKQKSRPL